MMSNYGQKKTRIILANILIHWKYENIQSNKTTTTKISNKQTKNLENKQETVNSNQAGKD